ncbi:PAS domain-containing protein [Altererythrobacter sp. RZ02]|uniref:PAS domain-containing protein n=1 Tax=Pontixanthobacter rizhaonensis TaxID=2730337 RepID=A0A848QLW5_9SPHN|nr:PAS domain-containing protein [Pontixanthobacter rizhaonensis]NMW31839.1 PAS domain-containing protein [Pontixanthobacter rizhaonensis]
MRGTSDEEIIKIAYSLSVGPFRYEEMLGALQDRYSEFVEETGEVVDGQAVETAFASLAPHFENAQALLESQGRPSDTARYSLKMIDADSSPAALIGVDGRVIHANRMAQSMLGLKPGERPDKDQFEPGHRSALLERLEGLETHQLQEVAMVFAMDVLGGDEQAKLALTKVHDGNGDVVGHVSTIHISWFPEIAERFRTLFKLTPVELEITKAVVTGIKLTELAKQRGRSVETVRHQTKMLLGKLGLRSQTELACLYSGFANFRNIPQAEAAVLAEDPRQQTHILKLGDDRVLEYDIIGDPDGLPVLMHPALLGGSAMIDEMWDAVEDNNLRLIVPWRPGMASTTAAPGSPVDNIKTACTDARALLDHLGIERCVTVGHITSAIIALACKVEMPDRITGVVNLNPVLPTISGRQVRLLDMTERMRMQMMRAFPSIGRYLVHGALAKVDTGYDQEYIHKFLDSNEYDLRFTDRDDVKHLFRAAFKTTTRQGYEPFTRELMQVASDWGHLFANAGPETVNLVGAHNLHYTPRVLEGFARDNDYFSFEAVPQTGHLLLYQKPELVFARIAEVARTASVAGATPVPAS